MRRIVAVIACTLGMALPAVADDWATCTIGDTSASRVEACSRVIDSGRLDDSRRAIAYRRRADALKSAGEIDRAIADYGQAIRLDRRDPQSFAGRAVAYMTRNELDLALRDLNEAIRLDPKSTGALNARGVIYLRKHDNDRAILDFDKAIGLDPTDVMMRVNRALAYGQKGDFDKAMADFAEAIRLAPRSPEVFHHRGRTFEVKGDSLAAIDDYTRAIKLDPNDPTFFNDRGLSYLALSATMDERARSLPADQKRKMAGAPLGINYENGVRIFTMAIIPCNGKVWLRAESGKDNYTLAIEDFTQAIKLDSGFKFAFANRGEAYASICAYDRALADYDAAIGLDPRNARWRYQRGLVKLAKGDRAGGRNDIAAAKAMNPKVGK